MALGFMHNIIVFKSVIVLSASIICSHYFMSIHNNHSVVMANNGILFVSHAAKAQKLCSKVSQYVKKVLYVNFNESSENMLPMINKQINDIYYKASSQCGSLDVRLLMKPRDVGKKIKTNRKIDVILYDTDITEDVNDLQKSLENVDNNIRIQKVPIPKIDAADIKEMSNVEPVKRYEYVALGGTFDRLHNGHKILLSQAVLRSTKHVTVGVTDVNMIQSKKLWELIEPVEQRIKAVLDFLTDINPDLEYNVLPIQDIYGPTIVDPNFQMIVVSEETVRGAIKINEKRKEKGFKPLESYIIGLAEDSKKHSEEEDKVSSSNQRMRLLGTILREPKPNLNIPDWPYVIGLAGGIASGKSNITEKLKLKGAAVVNCDIIAHELYSPGTPLNQTIADTFGRDMITGSGEVDRRKLGQLVFSDKEQLEKLNAITWPAVIKEAQNRIKALGEQGHRVVVMEAAVMVRAKWYCYCHQLWTVIIPPDEAVRRIQARNNLSEEEARQRVNAQPSNVEQVEMANVVFSPFWSYEYTQMQIDRAWEDLQRYLDRRQ